MRVADSHSRPNGQKGIEIMRKNIDNMEKLAKSIWSAIVKFEKENPTVAEDCEMSFVDTIKGCLNHERSMEIEYQWQDVYEDKFPWVGELDDDKHNELDNRLLELAAKWLADMKEEDNK